MTPRLNSTLSAEVDADAGFGNSDTRRACDLSEAALFARHVCSWETEFNAESPSDSARTVVCFESCEIDRQTDRQTLRRADKDKDRQAKVPPEMQMSELLAGISLIRHQTALAAALRGRELSLFKIIIF